MLRVLNFLLLAALLVSGCMRPTGSATRPAVLDRWSGVNAGMDTAGDRVVRTEAEWRTLWEQIGRDVPRPLNVAEEMAVAVFSGQKRSGGHAVEITEVREEHGKWVVQAVTSSPGEGMMTTQALTSPWAVAVVPRTPATFEVRVHSGSAGDNGAARASAPSSPSTRE